MSILFQLPCDLIVEVLSIWCDIKNIVNVDSSLCNSVERDFLNKAYKSNGFTIVNKNKGVEYCNLHLPSKQKCVKWIVKRNIKTST